MARPRIAMIAPPGGIDPGKWSGTLHHMARALRAHCGDVTVVAPDTTLAEKLGKATDVVRRRLLGHGRAYSHTPSLARAWGRSIERKLPADAQVIFAPAASSQIARLETDLPVVYLSDTTFRLMTGYYPEFADLPERYVRWGEEIERCAVERASFLVPPSSWAAESMRVHYGADAARIRVIPLGANLESVPSRETARSKPAPSGCPLLFLGVDWERKGGPIAFRTVAALRDRGVDATLTVVGCTPPAEFRASWMEVLGRIDKSTPEGSRRLRMLLLEAAFLLLPTRQECFGVVFCEASAHGTPSISTDTGGVGGAVREGENGHLLPPDADGEAYAALIARLISDPDGYRRLVERTRDRYEHHLSWDAWGRAMREVIWPLAEGRA